MIKDLILKNRSYRRFHQDQPVNIETLRELIELARLSPSAGNLQPLRYILSAEPKTNDLIFRHLAWAGYLTDWPGPADGERPSAYVVILADKQTSPTVSCDHGIAAQSILLGAAEKGLGGCIIGSIVRDELSRALSIPDRYAILLVLALGRPKETVVLETAIDDIRYWRDEHGVHHVPKRPLEEIILACCEPGSRDGS